MMVRLAAIVKTTDAKWIIPTRLIMGLLLAFPIGGEIEHLLTWCNHDTSHLAVNNLAPGSCTVFRGIELLSAVAFVSGLLLRVMALPALLIFGSRAISNIANSVFPDAGTLLGFIQLQGGWAFGVVYIVPFILMHDLFRLGSGGWSIDLWLSRRLLD
jgi:putative oxidoreductase